jgi:hypothetical protein
MIPNLPPEWNIGLSAWIVQDGNYPDFVVGEFVEFAVEFYQDAGTGIELCNSDVSAIQVTDTTYSVIAEKILQTDDVTVLDIGLSRGQVAVSRAAAKHSLPN